MSTNITEARKNLLYKLVSERYNLEIADAVRELLWVPDNISQARAQLQKAIAYIRDRQAMCRRSASMSIVGGALFAYHEAVVLPVSQLSKIVTLLAELDTTEHTYDKAVSVLQEMLTTLKDDNHTCAVSNKSADDDKPTLYESLRNRYTCDIAKVVISLIDDPKASCTRLQYLLSFLQKFPCVTYNRKTAFEEVKCSLYTYCTARNVPSRSILRAMRLLVALERFNTDPFVAVCIVQEMIDCCTESHITDAVALYQPVIPLRSESVEPTYEKTNGAWLLVQGVCGDSAAFVPAFFEFSDIGTLYPNALVFRTCSEAGLYLKKCNRISVHTATITNGYTMCTQRYYARDHLHHSDLCNLNELLNNVKKKPVPLRCDDDIVDSDIVHGARFVNGTYELHAAPWRDVDAYDRFTGTWFRTEQELIDAIEYAVRNQEILYG